jgi:hypothetical protein
LLDPGEVEVLLGWCDVPAGPRREGDKELFGEDGDDVLVVLLLLAEELVVDVDVEEEEEAVDTFD